MHGRPPVRVDEGGPQCDITRRRKARVSLAEWAEVALALMRATSDGNATATVVYGASVRPMKHVYRLFYRVDKKMEENQTGMKEF